MRKFIWTCLLVLMLIGVSTAQTEKPIDSNKLFYSANSMYEKREYQKALEEYSKALEPGIENWQSYYNMGNCYFKLGKLGRAILYYEKARRLMPQDSDLKANLNYANSLLTPSAMDMPRKNPIVTLIKAPFKDFSLNSITTFALGAYFLFIIMQIVVIINPALGKKTRAAYALLLLIFAASTGAFAIRYYDEEILRRGIVVEKGTECKYEPIDKSTTFYKLQEGDEVSVMKTRDGWRQIKRIDGKVGWVRQDAVAEI